jgi:Ankyrin repeat
LLNEDVSEEIPMSKTALIDALKKFDVEEVRTILKAAPELRQLELGNGLNLLQFSCTRSTAGDATAADRQLRLAKWLVSDGFDPLAMHTTAPGEDGEEEPANVSLVWFAVAKAQNNRLARFFLQQGASPGAMFAAAWWGNADIVPDLVQHGDDLNEVVGATPFHMAVDVLQRGVEGKPNLARRRFKTLKEMLRLGANPNIPASNGGTPLHTVLEKGYDVEVFKLLLQYGANPDLAGKDGRTVREIAARKKDRRYFNALASPNANSARSRAGRNR